MSDVVVVGGGVVGLTSAVVLAEQGREVTVWSAEFEGETTSAVAGGLVWPYRIAPEEEALEWAVESFPLFAALAEEPRATGVRLVRGTMVGGVPPRWAELTGTPPRTPLVDMSVYLPYLRRRLVAAGGTVQRRELGTLGEAAGAAPAVVNCTGMGARRLVPDPQVRPVRGQLVVVENPGVEEWYADAGGEAEETTYLLPHPSGLLLGGTAQDGAWSREPESTTAEWIIRRCAAVRPEVAEARVREHRVGLRPFRPRVRLDAETMPDGRTRCVHNYGHGGAGVTVAWGCAYRVARLLDGA